MTAAYRIGTSGWHYGPWRGIFYPADLPPSRMLAYYQRHFDSVEVNNSFYRLPKPETFADWRAATPPDFCFAVKASRFITHMKKLRDPVPALDRLLPAVTQLREKQGPLLFQLPPRWGQDAARLQAFLEALPPGRHAFEFRDTSWHHPEIYALLREHNAAFCIYELAGVHSPIEITADFTYVRLHGPEAAYCGLYGEPMLREWAARLRDWQDLRAVHVYFDNDQGGCAVRDALMLRDMLGA